MMSDRKSSSADEVIGFGEAMEQLEAILRRIEDEDVDIDQLAAELERAAGLLELCRGKIRKAELEVTQIVQTLEQPEESAGEEPEKDQGS